MLEILKKINKLINYIEEDNNFKFYFFLLILFILIRCFIEPFSTKVIPDFTITIHWLIFYITFIIPFIIIVNIITKNDILKITKIFFYGSFLIILAPILDLFFSKGAKTGYMDISNTDNIMSNYLAFFFKANNLKIPGVTLGMRIEIFLILLAVTFYAFLKTKSFIKTIITFVLLFTIGFIHGVFPYLEYIILENMNLKISNYKPLSGLLLWLIILFLYLNIYYLLYNKKSFLGFWKNFRLLRALHFYGMFIYGFILAEGTFLFYDLIDFYSLITTFIAIFFAGIFSLITNDIIDINIDSISNPDRPLVKKLIPIFEYKILAIISFFLAILYSFFTRTNNYYSSMFILIFIIIYALYSIPPIRLKRIPIISKLLISINSIVIFLYGYYFNKESLNSIPLNIIVYMIIFLTFAINFIDIKDYEGDLINSIKTIPTIFGLDRSKKICSFFILLAFCAFPLFIKKANLFPYALNFGIIEVFLVNKKNYKEFYVFLIYLFGLFFFILNDRFNFL